VKWLSVFRKRSEPKPRARITTGWNLDLVNPILTKCNDEDLDLITHDMLKCEPSRKYTLSWQMRDLPNEDAK
jgi:hypothetical protein